MDSSPPDVSSSDDSEDGYFLGRLSPDPSRRGQGYDGAVDRILKRTNKSLAPRSGGAIFIHAGAGYHSVTNEKLHLEACAEAARAAMQFIKAGGSAVQAVEAAIRSLEDQEITNAGYGSNLAIDGTVECDATIIDHLGRSGACGAVPMIKNPISLAKIVQELSSQPLSLRRVPPNILVGEGAKVFAREHGMKLTPNERLVSKNAQDRFRRWNEDLKAADAKISASSSKTDVEASSQYEEDTNRPGQRRDHLSAILTGTWNEGQPDSPSGTKESVFNYSPTRQSRSLGRSPRTSSGAPNAADRNPLTSKDPRRSSTSPASRLSAKRLKSSHGFDNELRGATPVNSRAYTPVTSRSQVALAGSAHDGATTASQAVDDCRKDAHINGDLGSGPGGSNANMHLSGDHMDEDEISDTVGAIAIDLDGNMAAGSSSGGIGMKHRGRVGPAALVGIGTAVIPSDPMEEDFLSVAAVTSGTGEHMATTMASFKCAERLYFSKRRGLGSTEKDEDDEDAIMESFILEDFMDHPGVRCQSSPGAIGVMAVKQTRSACYLYFGHNTDSFALCSMSTKDKEPLLTMSRVGEVRRIARGARKIALD